jgi:hypothetical protein
MSPHQGRAEKRVRLAIPVEISKLRDPVGAEHTITENVCSVGIRVLTRNAVEPNERLMLRFIERNVRLQARVVYSHARRALCCGITIPRIGRGPSFNNVKGVVKPRKILQWEDNLADRPFLAAGCTTA